MSIRYDVCGLHYLQQSKRRLTGVKKSVYTVTIAEGHFD